MNHRMVTLAAIIIATWIMVSGMPAALADPLPDGTRIVTFEKGPNIARTAKIRIVVEYQLSNEARPRKMSFWLDRDNPTFQKVRADTGVTITSIKMNILETDPAQLRNNLELQKSGRTTIRTGTETLQGVKVKVKLRDGAPGGAEFLEEDVSDDVVNGDSCGDAPEEPYDGDFDEWPTTDFDPCVDSPSCIEVVCQVCDDVVIPCEIDTETDANPN